jgi:TRAP-type C4-dicarboxylate transport system permease large subunit
MPDEACSIHDHRFTILEIAAKAIVPPLGFIFSIYLDVSAVKTTEVTSGGIPWYILLF